MAHVDPELLADLAEAELLKNSLKTNFTGSTRSARNTQAPRRTSRYSRAKSAPRSEQNAASPFLPFDGDRYDLDNIGIERHHSFYFPDLSASRTIQEPVRG